jgi:hypothetical protein
MDWGNIAQNGSRGELLGTIQWKLIFKQASNLSSKMVGMVSRMGLFYAIITHCLYVFTLCTYLSSPVLLLPLLLLLLLLLLSLLAVVVLKLNCSAPVCHILFSEKIRRCIEFHISISDRWTNESESSAPNTDTFRPELSCHASFQLFIPQGKDYCLICRTIKWNRTSTMLNKWEDSLDTSTDNWKIFHFMIANVGDILCAQDIWNK